MNQPRTIFAKSLITVLIFTAPFMTGCGTRHTSTVSTTEIRRDPDTIAPTVSDDERSTVEITKTEQTTESEGRHGIFGILWDLITLPFRALGAIL